MHNQTLLQLPREKCIDIEFSNIYYVVPDGRNRKKPVLKGISGQFKSGEMTAIMGPSGAGKTSLLNILTGFQKEGLDGTIHCTNQRIEKMNKKGASQYKKQSCYILQDDHLAPVFTVSEIMHIAAKLKIASNVSEKAKNFLIDDILDSLGLGMCKETRCLRLSGGQKKRLSIALELIDNPPIMFLDEPTTGLDSSSSTQCIKMLKALARGGRTIICTIHQPSAALYEMFDQVYILAEGHCIYQGSSLNTVQYLSSVGFNCPKYHNPADYLLEVANGEYGRCTDYLAQKAIESNWRTVANKDTKEKLDLEDNNHSSPDDTGNLMYFLNNNQPPSEFSKFITLLNRSFLQLYRDWTISHLKFALHIVVAIILGINYFNYGQDASKTVNNLGFLIISIVYLTYTSLMPSVLKFPSELAVLKKERFNNWYNLKTYYAAFLMTDVPMQIAFSIAFTIVSYCLSSQPWEWSRYVMVQSILSLVCLSASSIGIVLGTTVNPINGTFLGAIYTALMLSVGGFLIFFPHMSAPLYYLTYISYISFAMEGLVEAVYGFGRGMLPCPEHIDYCHYTSPTIILREIGMDKNNFWLDITYLVGCCMLFRTIAFCTLRRQLSRVAK